MEKMRSPAHNSTYPKVAVQWLNQAFCSYQSLCLVDSEVLLNCHLRVAAKRQTVQKLPDIVNNLFFNKLTCVCNCSNLIIIIIQVYHATQTGRRTKSDADVQPG